MASTYGTRLNQSGDSGHPGLIPDLRGNTPCFSLLKLILAMGFSSVSFIMFRNVASKPILLRVFFGGLFVCFWFVFLS